MDEPLISNASVYRSLWSRIKKKFSKRTLVSRNIIVGELPEGDFPRNYVNNQKFTWFTFIFILLWEQFRSILNLVFLFIACMQFVPCLSVGYIYEYWVPLCIILGLVIIKEGWDDIRRYRRDKEVNQKEYKVLILEGSEAGQLRCKAASKLKVGDIVVLQCGERVPADMILLRTNDDSGRVFIRTDQLDGEIDWKHRIPIPKTQDILEDADLLHCNAIINAEKPGMEIHSFIGHWSVGNHVGNLDIENTLWSGCVIASGTATGLVIYTGVETRAVMNNSTPRSKVGKLDKRVNLLIIPLTIANVAIAFTMIAFKGFVGPWYIFLFRFFILLSYIIPICLRVNLDMAKLFYAFTIQQDKQIKDTIMRSTTIPEELGRVQYLLADKTGTLTKNVMDFQVLAIGNCLYDKNKFHEVENRIKTHIFNQNTGNDLLTNSCYSGSEDLNIWKAVLALALCHNVTPAYKKKDVLPEGQESQSWQRDRTSKVLEQDLCDYQASSTDEIAIVKWTDTVGVSLCQRDLRTMSLKLRATGQVIQYDILQLFPFTSQDRKMGIIVKSPDGVISYYVKGADEALAEFLGRDWSLDRCNQLAERGLRTLAVAAKTMTRREYDEFAAKYTDARCPNARYNLSQVMRELNSNMAVIGVTGVEDKLADGVKETLASLKEAGMKIWILTGDKLQSAFCIARSLDLGSLKQLGSCRSRQDAHELMRALQGGGGESVLVVEGDTLQLCLEHYGAELVPLLVGSRGGVVARCSPEQKARVARELRRRGLHVAAVGDGGNDVAMLRDADIGIGIEGAEGRAASLAGDVSIRQFSYLQRLLLVHGRRCITRSATLTLFIVHRGLLISTMQAIFSTVFYFSAVSLYPGILMLGYATFYTLLPVLSLVLDKDISSSTAMANPKLYIKMTTGNQLSSKIFLIWTALSVYQGTVIMYVALVFFEYQLIHIVEISYTALIFTELIMIALTIVTWHPLMILAEVVSLLLYIVTVYGPFKMVEFDQDFIFHWDFWWKVPAITLLSCIPQVCIKLCTIISCKCRRR